MRRQVTEPHKLLIIRYHNIMQSLRSAEADKIITRNIENIVVSQNHFMKMLLKIFQT